MQFPVLLFNRERAAPLFHVHLPEVPKSEASKKKRRKKRLSFSGIFTPWKILRRSIMKDKDGKCLFITGRWPFDFPGL